MIKYNSILKINNSNLIKNYNFFKSKKNNLIVAPTIKANAYGLGAEVIFKLFKKIGVNHFFVATLDEGICLNNKDDKIKIYVLNGIQNYELKVFKKYKLIPIINSKSELNRIIKEELECGIHIDTGINRLGITFDDIHDKIYSNKNIKIVISHLSSADEKTNKYNILQRYRFVDAIGKFKNKRIIFSLSNSNGAVLSEKYLFNMIRPGIGLYGGNNGSKDLKKNLKNVVELKAKIIQIKEINKNEFVGYNQTYKIRKKSRIAIIGIGYADGIPRSLSNNGLVYLNKSKFKIIGRISMDSLTIDITNSKHKLKEGMYVDIINKYNDIEKFANQCNTISNEILTSIGNRVKRLYV